MRAHRALARRGAEREVEAKEMHSGSRLDLWSGCGGGRWGSRHTPRRLGRDAPLEYPGWGRDDHEQEERRENDNAKGKLSISTIQFIDRGIYAFWGEWRIKFSR